MAAIVTNPDNDKTLIPVNAAPLVQPLPSWLPNPNSNPPIAAKTNRLCDVIFGECSTFHVSRPDSAPDKNPPTITPRT